MELIALQGISKTYRLGEIDVPVLKDVSLTVSRGEFVALMGASGSGKTTLLNILGCLDRPTSGRYQLDGDDVACLSRDEQALLRNRKIGFIFQNFNLLPRTSALENVMMPLSYETRPIPPGEAARRAEESLGKAALWDRLHHEPAQLSGGEQQRVAIARALIRRPPMLLADEPTGNLDSKTGEEVLELFQRLNREEGVTIIVVTHDEKVARHAHRIIRIEDGVIQGDAPSPMKSAATVSAPAPLDGASWRIGRLSGLPLRALGILSAALSGLRCNVLRAALTTIGIIIGVAAVIAMMEIGRGSATAIQRTIAGMGANNLLVYPTSAAFGAATAMTLTPQDGEAILKECAAVRAVAPVVRARGQVVYGGRNWVPGSIYGTTPGFLDVREWPIAKGAPFTEREVRNAGKVCILGRKVARELFPGESPIDKEVRINKVPFKVIGTLAAKGATMTGMDQDDILLAPWTTIKFRVTGSASGGSGQAGAATSGSGAAQEVNTLSRVYPGAQGLFPMPSAAQAANTPLPVRFTTVDHILSAARTSGQMQAAIDQITRLLRDRHRIRPEDPDDFYVRDMTEISRTLYSTATTMTNLLLVVALISLVVGGVGIMNIMLVSVTERTREIGLRMAVGARNGAILRHFLAESVILCFCGGVAGILAGRCVTCLVELLLQWPTEFSLDAILAAFGVSAAIGIVFGFYPAWKASRLDPIIALRYE